MTECNGWVDFMVTFMARSLAVAGAMAVGVLCEAVPAQADVYAFGNTQKSAFTAAEDYGYATLDLYDGTTLVAALSTGGFQGWISNSDSSVLTPNGGPSGTNTSYSSGAYGGTLLADYFGFNLGTSKTPATLTVTSAKLVVYSGTITNNVTYNLFAATQWVSDLETLGDQNAALYENLVKGTPYGSFAVAQNTTNPLAQLTFALNSAAVTDIDAAIKARAEFAIAGQVEVPVPEPSTWIMMLAGFAGLGVVARRAARRRAATSAG
jgi:hypothetical protein